MTQTKAVATGLRETSRPARRDWTADGGLLWVAVVAGVYTVVQLVFVVPGSGLGWDETVYTSQVSRAASDTAFFSAPRARGITFLIAPVTSLTSSVDVLRVYLALLSGAGLFLALHVWRRLLPASVLALAGALFAGLWITVYYGPQVMPNLWVALGCLAAVGLFLRAARDRTDRAALIGLGVAVAFVALMRPTDAFWLTAPLALIALSVRRWRRWALLAALAVGGAVGCAEWIIEAYVSYGGLFPRLARASEIQGHLGWNLVFGDHMRSLDGRLLCRPCDVRWRRPATAIWWFALPLLTLGGVLVAARLRRLPLVLVPTLVGLSMAAQYLLLIGYAAPRFLLPVYALLALPTALFLTWIVRTAKPRPLVVALLVAAAVAHLWVQGSVVADRAERSRSDRVTFDRIAAEFARQGVTPPCVVSGTEAIRVAFRVGCASRQTGGHDGSITPAELVATGRERPVAFVVAGQAGPPAYARGWRVERIPDLPGLRNCRVYLSPSVHAEHGA
ncbi:ArnT family glycosyltransferase [Streptomyces sp. NBC_01506]|uniref:ArnT family glycosyltransferase n=1 Tax=Streptomyces sp. NBC_01506 TaxID=2903887 RepID=UPI00386E119F